MQGNPATRYDETGGGGTTTLDYDPTRPRAPKADPSALGETQRLVRDFISLNGTIVNCAGGISYRERAWLTCEETVNGPENGSFPKPHGYVFEVPVNRGPRYSRRAEPLVPMGRFAHEALAVDERTGIVYQTEDPGSGRGAGFYRYIPNDPDRLQTGGRLQMLGIRGRPRYDTRQGQRVGQRFSVVWYDIPNPNPTYETREDDPDSTFNQGFGQGGAKFNRIEGCWYDEGSIFFVSTSGGDAKNGDVNQDGFAEGYGQVWEYRPNGRSDTGGRLELIFESPNREALDSPDNLTVTPRGGLILCEDDAGSADRASDTHPLAPGITNVNRLIGLSERATRSSSGSTSATTRSSPARASAPMGRRSSSTCLVRRPGAWRSDAQRGDDLRDHRTVGQGAALVGLRVAAGGRGKPSFARGVSAR